MIRTSLQGVGIPIVLDPIPQTQMAGRRMVQNDLPLALSDIDKSAVIDTLYATLLLYVSHAFSRGLQRWASEPRQLISASTLQATSE